MPALAIAFAFIFLHAAYAGEFVFDVKKDELIGSEKGKLIVAEDGIEFRAQNQKESRRWPYTDIKSIDLASPRKLVVKTYEDSGWKLGADREYSFEISGGEIGRELYDFLLSKIERPLAARIPLTSQAYAYELKVKHRHRFGGCHGTLKIAEDRIVYDTENARDRRAWLYRDIESFGSGNPFNLRISTYTETYTFDLKERMGERLYDFIWQRVYRVREQRNAPR